MNINIPVLKNNFSIGGLSNLETVYSNCCSISFINLYSIKKLEIELTPESVKDCPCYLSIANLPIVEELIIDTSKSWSELIFTYICNHIIIQDINPFVKNIRLTKYETVYDMEHSYRFQILSMFRDCISEDLVSFCGTIAENDMDENLVDFIRRRKKYTIIQLETDEESSPCFTYQF